MLKSHLLSLIDLDAVNVSAVCESINGLVADELELLGVGVNAVASCLRYFLGYRGQHSLILDRISSKCRR